MNKTTRLLGRIDWFQVLLFAVLVGIGIIFVLPFVWMVSTSFSREANMGLIYPPKLIPADFSLFNYVIILKQVPWILYYTNSFVVAIGHVTCVLFVCSLAGYAFAKGSFPKKNLIFVLVLATMMIPLQIILIPLYLLMLKIKLYDTLWALVLPGGASGYAIFLMVQYMKTIPNELLDAARIDGSSEFRIYCQIMLPLCKPVIATLAVLFFLWNWNAFLWPLVVLDSMKKYTIPLGIAFFHQEYVTFYGLVMAGATSAIMPVLIVMVAFQKYIVRGIVLTGLKY